MSKEVAIQIARTTQTSASWLGIAALALLVAAGPAEATKKQKAAPDAEPVADVDNTEPMTLVVSVAAQKVDIYRGTSLLTTSAVSTGMAAHPTMIGAFSIIEKQRWHHSNIYSGAPMPWMNRITWSGTALHAGVVPGYPASHGCIRLTYAFAPKMFQMTSVGDNVIVSRGRPKPVLVEHPNLFQPSPPPAPEIAAEAHIVPTQPDSPSLPAMAAAASPVILASAESSTTVDSEAQEPNESAETHSQAEPPATVPVKHAVPDEADPNRVHAITPDLDDSAKTHAVPDPTASAPAAGHEKPSAAAVTPAPEAPAAPVAPAAPDAPAKIPPAAAKIDAGIAAAAMQAAEPRSEAPLRILLTRRTQRDRIVGVQQILASLGFLPAQDFDGTMGKATITAVKAFQKANGMPETGAVTDALVKKVYEVAGKGEPPAGHLFVRQSFARVFDTPVSFRDPEQPLGTHVYTALKFSKGDSKARWMTVDVQDGDGVQGPLDRIEIPSDVRQEISERLTPGSTFIVADTSINSVNLPKGGDFVVLAKSTASTKISQADDDAPAGVKKPRRRTNTLAKRSYYNSPWGGNGPWYARPW